MASRTPSIVVVLVLAVVAAGCGGASTPERATTEAAAPPPAKPARRPATRGPSTSAERRVALRKLARKGRPVFCGGGKRPWVALTFDDGPGPYTKLALKILHKARADATFFLVGRNVGRFPSAAKAEARDHPLGDHSWTHAYLPNLSPAGVAHEMGSTQAAVRRVARRRVALFRPPYGARNAVVDATARRLGMVDVLWSIDSRDSEGADWQEIARRVTHGARPGSIVLMHENRGQTIRALKFEILPRLRRRHLELVTVPRMLAEDPPSAAQLRAGRRGCRGS